MNGAEPNWIDDRDVLVLHDRLLVLHGGAAGVRDEGLLKSATARARQMFAYDGNVDIVDMAGAYTVGIVQNTRLSMAINAQASSLACSSSN